MRNILFFTVLILQLSCLQGGRNVDKINIGDSRTIFSKDQVIDHSIIYNQKDKRWHLFGIISPQTSFIHLTADSLMQSEWAREDIDFIDSGSKIWAPHIIEHDDLFYMFYTRIGEPRQICCAISLDLYNWSYFNEPILAQKSSKNNNLKNKDPMIFFDEDQHQWVIYYSMMKDDKHWVVGYSTSGDLKSWSDYKICFDEDSESPGVESPFVVKWGDFYYLFLSARPWPYGGEDIFKSDNPYCWQADSLVKRFYPWHAAELVEDLDSSWYVTHSSSIESSNLMIAPLILE